MWTRIGLSGILQPGASCMYRYSTARSVSATVPLMILRVDPYKDENGFVVERECSIAGRAEYPFPGQGMIGGYRHDPVAGQHRLCIHTNANRYHYLTF